MELNEEEKAMLAGAQGPARQWAVEHQLQVGRYFGARDLVPIAQAHIMADTESLGEAGILWLERWAALPVPERRVRVPTTSDPRGTDFAAAARLKHEPWMIEREKRAAAALAALGVLMTDTCITYQTVMPPVFGEHLAYGDTGVVIYSNSIFGARSNFEGGPSAVAAALTGRTPRYGYHLDECRRPSLLIDLGWTPRDLNEWGALGGVVGRLAGDYWAVPLLLGVDRVPGSDEMKHFGAAAASHGSLALFHIEGITPEARHLGDIGNLPAHPVGEAEIRAFQRSYGGPEDGADVVVFAAPQLSLVEMQSLAGLLDGRRATVPLFAATSPQVKADADRLGLSHRIEAAGGTVLSGMCFYNSYAREMAEASGWRRLASNSAKLVNILGGYGYRAILLSMAECVDLACKR
ncbi:MAG TPA: aconitase X catalytic domain-containing protein [Stellaceae bacterium]|nr:aconitase X catalytic domain-containing protein [Stellaceae bacterium]